MIEHLKKLFLRYFDVDYVITGDYLERGKNGHLYKKYLKRYKIRKKGTSSWMQIFF